MRRLPGCENHAFQNQMRSMLEQKPVFETAGLVFPAVADDVTLIRGCFRRDGPLSADRKTRAAAAAQSRSDDFVENFRR